eukprot:gene9112-9870_t
MIYSLFLLPALVSVALGAEWRQGQQLNTMLGVCVGGTPYEVFGAVVSSPSGSGIYYNANLGNGDAAFVAGGALNMDIEVTKDGNVACVVGPGKPGGIFCGPAGAGFTPNLVTDGVDVIAHSIQPFGDSGFAVTGHFYLDSCDGTLEVKDLEEPPAGFLMVSPKNKTKNHHIRRVKACSDKVFLNGVAVTRDYGLTWNGYSIGLPFRQGYNARYGSFPSEQVWYTTFGSWPNNADEKLTNGIRARVSGRISVYYDAGDTNPQITFLSARNVIGSYPGGIMKTINGGDTWFQVFNTKGQYYLNQISCFDVNNCYAVGENGKEAYVIATTNGGVNWDLKMTLTAPRSLHAVQMVSLTEIFVAGGTPSVGPYPDKELQGEYYHSTDGGNTWDLTTYNGYGFDLSFKNGIGYATALFKRHTDLWVWSD